MKKELVKKIKFESKKVDFSTNPVFSRKNIILCLFIGLVLLSSFLVIAHPPIPTEFFGKIVDHNNPVPPGNKVSVYYNSELCGSFTISRTGFFGLLSCKGYDPEGNTALPNNGDNITFFYNNLNNITIHGNTTWKEATFKNVNITYPPLVCGDGFCDDQEGCLLCPEDCGYCPENITMNETNTSMNISINTTINETFPPSETPPGTGSGDKKTSDSSKSPSSSLGPGIGSPSISLPCIENWQCSPWNECLPEGLQYRTCTDINSCGTFNNKPEEVQECSYEEEIIDITKPPGQAINQTKPPFIEKPVGKAICGDGICSLEEGCSCPEDCRTLPVLMILIVLMMVFLNTLINEIRIEQIRTSKTDNKLERAKKYIGLRKKMNVLNILIIYISSVLIIYHHILGTCPEKFFKNLWIIGLLLLLIPFIIHIVIRILEYDEKTKIKKQLILHDTHYRQTKNLLILENKLIKEFENKIISKIQEVYGDENKTKLFEEFTEFYQIYSLIKDVFFAYEKRKSFDIVENLEEDIIKLIKQLEEKESELKDNDLKEILRILKKLHKAYETKAHIIKELVEENEKVEAKVEKSFKSLEER